MSNVTAEMFRAITRTVLFDHSKRLPREIDGVAGQTARQYADGGALGATRRA